MPRLGTPVAAGTVTTCATCEYRPIAFDPKPGCWVHVRGTVRRADCSTKDGKAVPMPVYQDDTATVYLGLPEHFLPILGEASVDLVLTKTPEGLGAIGLEKVWDGCNRVVKLGGYVMRYGQRTTPRRQPGLDGRNEHHDKGTLPESAVVTVEMAQRVLRALCPPKGVVLDPFAGDGVVAEAAHAEGMRAILIAEPGAVLDAIKVALKAPVQQGLF